MHLINIYIIFAVIFAIINVSREQSTTVPIEGIGNLDLKSEVVSNPLNNPSLQPPNTPTETTSEGSGEKAREIKRYPVASFDFEHVAAPFIITAWIFVACGAKIIFHVTPRLANLCPESCMLLVVGVILGLVLFHSGMIVGPLTPTVFFLFMLPPIVFDAGYFMPNRLFFDNIFSILVYAVIGTVWNTLSIGVSLWAIGLTGIFGYEVSLIEMLLFSSIVSAVDPVAVLAVFEEIHVNEVLYIIVFGESLLNDAVTVVLYHMFEGYTEMGIPNILPIDYFSGVASFFVVSVGGTMIGILFGLLTAFLSKHTTSVPVIEPMFPFIMGYMSYLSAEMFHLSGILSLIFCGITMKNYVEENISAQSHVTVKYVTKMLATASETIIFVVLGVSTVNDNHEWNTWFVFFSILFCTIYRAIGVVVLSAFLNKFRLHQLNGVEQFIMSYGGLRGAVAFALALIIDKKIVPSKDMMVTTTIAVVYFTVFAQGMTIKYFVRILKVPQKSEKEVTMNERLHGTVIDHVMGGIEEVADQFLGNYKMRDRFRYFNNKYLRRYLTNHSEVNEPKIFETHSKLNLMDAMNMVNNGSKLTPEPGVSFSTLLKNYTAANLNTLAPDEVNSVVNHSPLMNLDMGELTYNPSFKDLNDSEIHHILEDAMFKPMKRSRRYSHSQFDENEPRHPPFHHHMRMQIRRLVSESKRRRKKYRTLTVNNGPMNDNKIQPISTIYLHSGPNHPQVTLTTAGDSDNDEGGITFSATNAAFEDIPPTEEHQRTLTETVLPWKRDQDVNANDPAKPQEEFPTWVNNRDYYPGYLSPTPTFLESIKDHQPGASVITDSIEEEEDDCFEPEMKKPKSVDPTKAFDEHSFGQVEEDIIKEVMKEAQQSRSPSITHEERRRMFRNLGRRSPDRFSLTSVPSEDFSRPTSELSIECPDVVLDLENEEESKNTKL
ncbi:sodium/hydrogen exchanger 3-like [Argiope bruennichi]|uniref:sodium/hydrogen exchanger 3-like n=1 Tax=Argiope bruennichi TaxID=94029 RepID=UPI002493EFDC|nr:sodium/hydrogen exchanger 3-like [Argiope bruennichi]